MSTKYDRYPIEALSGGNKRKLMVMISNLADPHLLLLDEPTSGIDPVAAEKIVSYLRALKHHQTVLFASHRIDECVQVCSRVIMVHGGRLHFDGVLKTFDELCSRFYQVDIVAHRGLEPVPCPGTLPPHTLNGISSTGFIMDVVNDLKRTFTGTPGVSNLSTNSSDESVNFIRVVVYSPRFARLTIEKRSLPLSLLWIQLQKLKVDEVISKYSFRKMDMEEMLAIIIETTSSVD